MSKKKEVAVSNPKRFEIAERPDYLSDKDRGSENVNIDDVTLPRLSIIQDLSPQHKKSKPEYIEGAEVGMLFNTVSQQLYDEPIVVVPVYFRTEFLIWLHRDSGGGFLGSFPTEQEAAQEAAKHPMWGQVTAKQEPIVEVVRTGVHFCLLINKDGGVEEIVISMSKSQLKPSRTWNSMIKIAGGDRFSKFYRIEAVETEGKSGEYQNYKITGLGYVDESTYKRAEALYETIARGERGVDYSDVGSENSSSESTDETVDDEL